MTWRDYSQILQLNGISGNMLKLLNIFRKKWKQVLPNGHGFLWQILVLVSPKVLFLVLFLLIYVNDLSSYLNTKLNTHQTQTHSPNFVIVSNNWLHRDSSLLEMNFLLKWNYVNWFKKWRCSNVMGKFWKYHKVVTLQSSLQSFFNVASTSLKIIFWDFLKSYLSEDNRHLNN